MGMSYQVEELGQKTIAEFLCGEDRTSDSITNIIA
jgi:hypothetical protein